MDDPTATNLNPDNPVNEDYQMASLIDLNADREYRTRYEKTETADSDSVASILRPGEATLTEKQSIGFVYGLIGLAVGLGASILLIIITLIAQEHHSFMSFPELIGASIFLCIAGAVGALLIGFSQLATENEKGLLRVDDESITYWTSKGEVSIPMSGVFGAAPVANITFDHLRIYFLSGNNRCFDFAKHNFKRYRLVNGPDLHAIVVNDDGNTIVRKTIMHYRNQRKKAGLSFAKVPSYQFRSVQKPGLSSIFGNQPRYSEFSCDGNTLLYSTGDQKYRIPVEMIDSAKVVKVQSQYGVSKWVVNLHTNPASGFELVPVNVLHLPYSKEIENYCRAVATSFLEKDSGYWD